VIIGIPKEIKDNEYRIGMPPAGVHALVEAGHTVYVEQSAGEGSGFEDHEFVEAGAKLLPDAKTVYGTAEMIIKVKEPIEPEYELLQEGQILYTYLHLAPIPVLTQVLMDRKVTGVAYETITDRHGGLPLLAPMSEVAGRLSVQVGAYFLMRPYGGCGVLPGGVPGVPPASVTIIGGGIVGLNAAKMARGLGASVTILERDLDRIRYLDDIFHGTVITLASNLITLEQACVNADMVVGAVLIPGAAAPKLITRDIIGKMKKGSVIVDVSVDQGGCVETTHPTTHSNPVYEVDGVVHYCVANMPGSVPRTSTLALTNATLRHALDLANKGFVRAVKGDPGLADGVNTYKGKMTCQAVADSQNLTYTPLEELL
jgi:alanine dehydrogenase